MVGGCKIFLLSIGAVVIATFLSGCDQADAFVTPVPVLRQPTRQLLHPSYPNLNQKKDHFLQRGMAADNEGKQLESNKLPFFLGPGTYGGVIVLSLLAFVVPILFYQFITNVFHVDGVEAGVWIGGLFTVFATLAWASTYLFRVATKDMTYVSHMALTTVLTWDGGFGHFHLMYLFRLSFSELFQLSLNLPGQAAQRL